MWGAGTGAGRVLMVVSRVAGQRGRVGLEECGCVLSSTALAALSSYLSRVLSTSTNQESETLLTSLEERSVRF